MGTLESTARLAAAAARAAVEERVDLRRPAPGGRPAAPMVLYYHVRCDKPRYQDVCARSVATTTKPLTAAVAIDILTFADRGGPSTVHTANRLGKGKPLRRRLKKKTLKRTPKFPAN
jgi:hypothetical protein